jgi:hypothetical protein
MASLSLQLAQWNWITRADAGCLQRDGKTLCSFTVVSYYIDLEQLWLIVIRYADRQKVEYLKTLVGLMFTLNKNIRFFKYGWLIGSLTGSVVFNIVAKYIQIFNKKIFYHLLLIKF